MFSWLGGDDRRKKEPEVYKSVSDGLRQIYKQKLFPLEEHYKFHDFHSPALEDADFDAKPMILLVGQYSTGKTTFIRYLLETDFPGMRIGPEPTTDRFIAVMYDEEDGMIPGMNDLPEMRFTDGCLWGWLGQPEGSRNSYGTPLGMCKGTDFLRPPPSGQKFVSKGLFWYPFRTRQGLKYPWEVRS